LSADDTVLTDDALVKAAARCVDQLRGGCGAEIRVPQAASAAPESILARFQPTRWECRLGRGETALRLGLLCDPARSPERASLWSSFAQREMLDVRLVVDQLAIGKDFRGVSNKLAHLECVACGRLENCFEARVACVPDARGRRRAQRTG
jgi:hypothetical protein